MGYLFRNISVIALSFISLTVKGQLDTVVKLRSEVNYTNQGLSLLDLENKPLSNGFYFIRDEGKSEVSFGEISKGKKSGLWLYSSMRYDDKVLDYHFGDTCVTIIANGDLNIKSIDIRKIEEDTTKSTFVGVFDDYKKKSLFRMVYRINEKDGLTFNDFAIEFYSIRIDNFSYVPDKLRWFSYDAIIRKYFE